MRNISFFILAFYLYFQSISAQNNLVPNPSFETYDDCPTNWSQIIHAKPWLPSYREVENGNLYSSADFFHSCNNNINNNAGVPSPNQDALIKFFQYPKTGNGYAAIIIASHGLYNYREYLEVKLLDSLQQGKKYCVEFWINFAGNKYATDAIGACLSKDTLYSMNPNWSYLINANPQIINLQGNILKDSIKWVNISGIMIAEGGEQFITIGNFKNDELTFLDTVNYYELPCAYYLVDDVSVVRCEEINPIPIIVVYPSPALEDFTIEAKGNTLPIDFEIYNTIGQLVYKSSMIEKTVVPTANFAAGMYVIRFRNSERLEYRKVVKCN